MPSQKRYGRSSTRPTSRTAAFAAIVPKVAICDTESAPYFFFDVVDDAVAAVLAEVDVEVRHRHALGIEQSLEDEAVAQRIEVGDAEGVGDERARAGAASRAHRHAVVLRPVDEIGDDQEVAGEAHLHDGRGLEVEPRDVVGTLRVARRGIRIQHREPPLESGGGLVAQVVVQGDAGRRGKVGQEVLAERDRHVAALRDGDGVGERLGKVGEGRGHLGLRLEILLGRERLGRRASAST